MRCISILVATSLLAAPAAAQVIGPDAFAEDWTYIFTFSPVTKNPFQRNPPDQPVDHVTRAALLVPVR